MNAPWPAPLNLPAAPAGGRRVLACGAFLKNSAGLLDGAVFHGSPLHDDLSTPEACVALEASLGALVERAGGRIDAVAHDLHPDFHSTRLAQAWAVRLGVPAVAVQHHHAHAGVVMAEQAWRGERAPALALALDGVGLGTDGAAWGGELLAVRADGFERIAHLPVLPLPGGDVAAREPWRLAAAVLHGQGRGAEIVARFGPTVGDAMAAGVQTLLDRGLRCPPSTGAGRWFDAAAGLLGLSLRQAAEAEAAIALERAATDWLARNPMPELPAASLDLAPLVADLADESEPGRGAARFHGALSQGLVAVTVAAAQRLDTDRVALGGGCFFNRLLSAAVTDGLQAAGLRVCRPQQVDVGDAGLALGQAWVAALSMTSRGTPAARPATARAADRARAMET